MKALHIFLTERVSPVRLLAILAILGRISAFAMEGQAFPSEKEVRQKIEAAMLDQEARRQIDGVVLFQEEPTEFRIKTLSITKSRSTSEPLILFCGTSAAGNRPDIEEGGSEDICGVFDMKRLFVYILSDKARPGISIRPLPLSKTTDLIILDGACGEYSCDHYGVSVLFEYNASAGALGKIWSVNTYSHVSADGPDGSSEYIDRGVLSEGVRGSENMREIILTTTREDIRSEPPEKIKEIKEWYSWRSGRPYLVQRNENGRLVLDRAAGERLYSISRIDVSTSSPGRMGLIGYLADENQVVAAAARQAIFSHVYDTEKAGAIDRQMISELIRRYLDKTSPCRSGAWTMLSHFRSFAGFSLAMEERDLLWKEYSGGYQDDLTLQLLVSVGDERALSPLLEQFKAAVAKNDACAASDASGYMRILAGKGVSIGAEERAILANGARADLTCNNGCAEWNVSIGIAKWLDPEPGKLPAGCAPRENFPEPIRRLFPEKDGFSGIRYLGNTARSYCRDKSMCKIFSKKEIYRLQLDNLAESGRWVDAGLDNFTDEATFGIQYCRLRSNQP